MYCKRKKIEQHDLVYDNKSRKYIPKRGYYSELVSELSKDDPTRDICSKKRMKLILQVIFILLIGLGTAEHYVLCGVARLAINVIVFGLSQ